jgi:Fe-S cluster assembly protein SufD
MMMLLLGVIWGFTLRLSTAFLNAYAQQFEPVARRAEVSLAEIGPHIIPGALRIVFVDGSYSAALSDLPQTDGVEVAPLGLEDAALHAYFGKAAKAEHDVFAALNTRFFDDCAWVRVKGEAPQPIHVLHVATKRDAPGALYPRCLVVLEGNARATLIEQHVGEAGANFANGVTEIHVHAHAALRHVRVQQDGLQAFNVAHCAVTVERGGKYDATALAFGARLSRHTLHVALQGEGSEVMLDGLALIDGRQVSDAHTRIDHIAPNCKSVQRHKCIADGTSHAVFSGEIMVHKGAKGTDSNQSSRNLLLSGRAKIDAQPQLEILNDDVSCKHGATVGQLDMEELFYLKSRGLDEEHARKLLIYAFAAEIVDRIPVASLVGCLQEAMFERMGGRFA